jgi:DNA repair protein RecO (recombination protein O)
LFHRANLFLARGRDFDIVTQAETVESFARLRDDLVRSAAASYVVELLDRLTPEEEENPAAYRLIVRTLEELCGEGGAALTLRCYDLKLLEVMGYRPELFQCTVGGEAIKAEDQFFSPERGGVVCPRCAEKTEGKYPISLAALRVLRHLQRSPLEEAFQLRVRTTTLEELEPVLQRHIQYLLEFPLRSRKFFSEVSRMPKEGEV